MRVRLNDYPKGWRWRFAIFPTYLDGKEWLWLEFYQCRKLGPLSYERRDRKGKTFAVDIYP